MDANGTRLHLVLGFDDWARSIVAPADPRVCFDGQHDTLGLRPRPFIFPTRAHATPLLPADRRGAGVDRYGNRFWIGSDRRSVWASRAAETRAFSWWPPTPGPRREPDGAFTRCESPAFDDLQLSGLAITPGHHLVVGVLDLPVGDSVGGGLLVFDLTGGGPPLPLGWPAGLGVRPFDLAATPDGGVVVLDVAHPSVPGPARLWHVDRHLRVVPPTAMQPADAYAPHFRPVDTDAGGGDATAAVDRCDLHRADAACAVALDVTWATAVEALPDGSVLVLDRVGPRDRLEVSRWRCGHRTAFEIRGNDPTDPATTLACTDQRASVQQALGGAVGHDLVAVAATDTGALARLFIVDDRGDQAFEFVLDETGADLVSSYHPLRLFSGKALISDGSTVSYDLADRWYPIPTLPVRRYATEAVIVLAPGDGTHRGFDAGAPGTVWHRLVFDAAIPPGTTVSVDTRAADDLVVLQRQRWLTEPDPYLRGGGSEIPYHEYRPGACVGQGSWELLLQHAVGRYLQVRLTLRGDGRRTPRLWAARLHYPRFSYLEHYLPDIYRGDRESAWFLDRYLANAEGLYTALEGRITAIRRLVDPKTIDTEFLPWLAAWVGAVVEPDWEPERQRLLVRYAARMFTRRGTPRGLIEAIRLATDPCPTEAIFDPDPRVDRFDVRVVEAFRTRSVPGTALGDPTDLAGPRYTAPEARWRLTEGGSALQRRWRAFLADRYDTGGGDLSTAVAAAWGAPVAAVGTPPAFPVLTPVIAAAARDWGQFVRAELAVTYADVGANDLAGYRAFLAQRYRRIEDYRTAWAVTATAAPGSFGAVGFPAQLPADGAPLQDWMLFVSSVLPVRRAAHQAMVLVPIRFEDSDEARRQRLGRVQRVVDVERPAHTLVTVAPYWAAFRVGSARVGFETIVGEGSRYVDLVLGADRLAHAAIPGGANWRVEDRVVVGRNRIERSAHPAGTGGQ